MRKAIIDMTICLAAASVSYGQAVSGTILGIVKDATGAAIPQATVTISNKQTGLRRSVATDSSGGCHNGAYAPATIPQVTGAVPGDGSIATNAVAQTMVASLAGTPVGPVTQRTLEVWFKSGDGAQRFIMHYSSGFGVAIETNLVHIFSDGLAGVRSFRAPYVLSDDQWHLMDLTFDGTTVTPYIDGQSIGTATFGMGGTQTSADQLQIGDQPGSYDEAALYPTALPADRITAHWTAGGSANPARCATQARQRIPLPLISATPPSASRSATRGRAAGTWPSRP